MGVGNGTWRASANSVGAPLPLRASLAGDAQHGPREVTRTSTVTHPTCVTVSKHRPDSEGNCRMWKVTLHPPNGGVNTTTTTLGARPPKATVRPMRNVRLMKIQQPPNQSSLLGSMSVRKLLIRIKMRTNQKSTQSTPSQAPPIPIPFILGIPLDQADHPLLPQCYLWHRAQIHRLWIRWRLELITFRKP